MAEREKYTKCAKIVEEEVEAGDAVDALQYILKWINYCGPSLENEENNYSK